MISVMGRQTTSGLSLLVIIFGAIYSQPARAQSPPCVDKMKLPYPTFAEEIRSENAGEPVTSIIVSDLRIEGDVHGRDAVQKRILAVLGQCDFVIRTSSLNETAGGFIRSDFQRRGYFEASVEDINVEQLDIKDGKQRMLITSHVKEGNRYRVGKITFENTGFFREGALRRRVPLHEGKIFDIDKLRDGIQRLSEINWYFGYIDATVQPDIEVDRANHTISANLKIVLGRPYTIENVEVYGLSTDEEAKVRSWVAPRDLCNSHMIEGVFLMYKSALPVGTQFQDAVQVTRNTDKHTVKVVFDFRNPAVVRN
jgi:hypothetical protein